MDTISILALIISIIAAVITWLIYSKQKRDVILQSFYNDFATFLASFATGKTDDATFILIKLKIEAGFLKGDLFDKFQDLLYLIQYSIQNQTMDEFWKAVKQFIIDFTKTYNPKSRINLEYLNNNLWPDE